MKVGFLVGFIVFLVVYSLLIFFDRKKEVGREEDSRLGFLGRESFFFFGGELFILFWLFNFNLFYV